MHPTPTHSRICKRACRPALWSSIALLAVIPRQGRNVSGFTIPRITTTTTTTTTTIAYSSDSFVLPRRMMRQTAIYSAIGGGGEDGPPKPPSDNSDGDVGGLGDFLDPSKQESENLKKAREYMSDTSLPISFDADESEDDQNPDESEKTTENLTNAESASSSQSAMVNAYQSSLFGASGEPSAAALSKNPYMHVVSKLSPSELISKFTATSDPRVQDAVRSTILGLIGSLPKMAFDTTTITTGQRLASLMFQLQMTGYMFKNAEYRLSLSQSLGMSSRPTSNLLLSGSPDGAEDDYDHEDEEREQLFSGKIRGKLKLRYGGSSAPDKKEEESTTEAKGGMEMEVDAAAYMSELRSEVSKLRDELTQTRQAKEETVRKDLLLYIRTLPAQELKALTNTMSQDVLVCMKGLIQAVLAGIGEGQIGPDTVTEQSGEAMAQLCMWQLALGYNLRELEVREEMKQNLKAILGNGNEEGGVDFSAPGALE